MNLNHTINEETKCLTITLEGKIDSNNAAQTEAAIMELRQQYNDADIIFDATKLEYISSAGLRVLLSTQKKMQQIGTMKVINVSEEVFEVFEITGFADILVIE